jgi:cytochrome P450
LQKNEYAEDLQQAAASSAIRVMFPRIVDTLGYLRLPKFNDIRKRIDRLKGYAITSIERYENLVKADLKNAPHTIFSKMFQAGADDKMTIGEVTISAQSLIIAGSDTTANTLTYLTWEVCRNPDIKRKLLEELSRLPEDYNESHLRELSYLDHVIDETLRVHSIVPGVLPRVVPPEGANIGGYWLNGGTGVAAQAYTMHRNEDIFPGPYTFNPMRWENTTKAMKESFMPFGRGSRSKLTNRIRGHIFTNWW